MNNVVWLPEQPSLTERRVSRSPGHAEPWGLEIPVRRNNTGLCIPCALTNHDFKQRMPSRASETVDEEPTPKAWVDGRRYRMAHYAFPNRPACGDCGDKVYVVYEPEL